MAGSRQLRRRIQSAKNISQITGAMEAVAASKMKKAQLAASGGQPYQEILQMIVAQLRRQNSETVSHPLLVQTEDQVSKPGLYILISSDRGLCGALNSNLFRAAERTIPSKSPVVAVGKKAVYYAERTDWEMLGAIPALGDYPGYLDVKPASHIALEEYLEHRISSVTLVYQKFHNTLIQRPASDVLLPIQLKTLDDQMGLFHLSYTFEPGREALLEDLLPYYVHMSLYQSVLSAKAAEQSARMIAMKNASENADDVRKNLQLLYNQERQKVITSEISDVVTAGLALG